MIQAQEQRHTDTLVLLESAVRTARAGRHGIWQGPEHLRFIPVIGGCFGRKGDFMDVAVCYFLSL